MLTTLVWLTLAAAPVTDPLAPSREGYIGCIEPDVAHRTCLAIKHYRWKGARVTVEGDMLTNDARRTVVRTTSEVAYVGAAVCSWMPDPEAGVLSITVEGRSLKGEEFQQRRREFIAPLLSTADEKYCVTFEPTASEAFIMQPSLDGAPLPDRGLTLLWIRPDDGWRLDD